MALGDAQTSDFWTSLSCGPCANGGSRSPPPTTPGAWSWTTGDAHAGIRAAVRAILPGAAWQRCRVHIARTITSRLGSARPRARGRPGLHDLRPDQSGGRGGPVPARHRRLEGRLPFRIAQMLKDAKPDPTAFATTRPPRGALDQDPAAATPSSASTGRSSAEQTSSRCSPTASPHAP